MPLARVGARTDSTTHYSYNARRGQYPRTRIGIESKTRCKICSMRRGFCTLVLFIGFVCVSVCLCVWSHLTYGASVRPENAVTYSAGNEGQKICGDLPETTAFKSYAAKYERKSQYANYSDLPDVSFLRLTHSEAPEGTQRLSTTFSLAQNYAY